MTLTTLCNLPKPKRHEPLARAARVKLHRSSHKLHTTIEGVASMMVAYETHIPYMAILSILWAILDFYCLLDPKMED